jgi:hypothetical protein
VSPSYGSGSGRESLDEPEEDLIAVGCRLRQLGRLRSWPMGERENRKDGIVSTEIISPTQDAASLLERVVIGGDLSGLTPAERVRYYTAVCDSVGLNPLTRPFEYITFQGKLVLYARKDCTEQLRTLPRHAVSIEKIETSVAEGVYCVTAYARDSKGRTDVALGAVSLEGLKGEVRANAMMRAETKAKRRVTLSICGLGILDESEIDTLQGAIVGEPGASAHQVINKATGEVIAEPDVNVEDRTRLLKQIKVDADYIGLSADERKALWAENVGPASPTTAPIEKVMELADYLATTVSERKKGRAG